MIAIDNYYQSTSPITTLPSLQNPSAASSEEVLDSFQQMLSAMVQMNSESGDVSGSGFSGSDLFAPMMLLLIEKLLSQQLEQNGSTTSAQKNISPAAAAAYAQNEVQDPGVSIKKPVSSNRVTQEFGGHHIGIDYGIPVGTEVRTTMDGEVVFAGWDRTGYGNLVIVDNGPYKTYYAHLSSIPVSVGETVSAGTVVGLSGSTGNSTGPHLHYEVRHHDKPIDPSSDIDFTSSE